MKRLIYVPLEQYQERYTEYQSSPDGVYERAFKQYGVPFVSIRPHNNVHRIKTGVVLDAYSRCSWAFEQTKFLVNAITTKQITSDDVIYFEDFWHPGMEMIPYTLHLVYPPDQWPQIYSFWHAQSVDPFDFTHKMDWWIRNFEKAWAHLHDNILIASKEMSSLMDQGRVFNPRTVVGLPYSSDIIRERYFPSDFQQLERRNRVVFSSRWDKEKCPDFFCKLVTEVMNERSDIEFVVCTGAKELRSNSLALLDLASEMESSYPENFKVLANLTKAEYFKTLLESKVQFNCADQDFVSLTILDASTAGCQLLYPEYCSFPDVLEHKERFMYVKGSVDYAKSQLYHLLNSKPEPVDFVYKKHEDTVLRMLHAMGFAFEHQAVSL